MDRQITYPGQLLTEGSLLQATKDAMIGAAKLASALLGTSTMASGFAVTPTGPASLQVLCAPGEIYSLTAIDALAFSSLPADTTHSILKQGILLDGVTLSCPAPVTTGQSINYLVQVTYQDSDSTPVLLPYYNSANPAMPFSGMGNNGLTQNTVRKGVAVVAVKAGASATTGSQVTPAPDAGYIGLYVVTVAFGQTTITAGNITTASNAPLINSTLHGLTPVFTAPLTVATATAGTHAMQLQQAVGRIIAVRVFNSTVASYTPSLGTNSVYVRLQAGGGGGGGAVGPGASGMSIGAAGGAGAYAEAYFTSGFSGVTITLPAGGLGGTGAVGSTASSASFGALMSCPGGVGGGLSGPSASGFIVASASSAAPSGGTVVNSRGSGSDFSISLGATNGQVGRAGASVFGIGGPSSGVPTTPGSASFSPGAGGGGTALLTGATAATGGQGGNSICIVIEYT